MLETLVPQQSMKQANAEHGADIAWRRFVHRCPSNAHIRVATVERENWTCPACGEKLDDSFQVHHTSYAHKCDSHLHGPDDRTPHCGRCKTETPECFARCLAKLRAVHPGCNAALSGHLERDVAPRKSVLARLKLAVAENTVTNPDDVTRVMKAFGYALHHERQDYLVYAYGTTGVRTRVRYADIGLERPQICVNAEAAALSENAP